jgi:FkbM family methyltransferase
MSYKKFKTLLALIGRGDFSLLAARTRFFLRDRKLMQARAPFIYSYGEDRMVCDPDVPDSRDCFIAKPTDFYERQLFRSWLEPGDVVIDAGANIGLFTAVACEQVGAQGQVVAIEPTPFLASMIQRNARLLGHSQLCVREAALGKEAGRAQFAFAAGDETAVSQSLAVGQLPEGTQSVREVEVISLLDALASIKPQRQPALVKLDVEGAEEQALLGSPAAWRTEEGPLWIVECHPEALARFGTSPERIYELFPESDFACFTIGKFAGPNGVDLPPARLIRTRRPEASFWNLLAVPLGERWRSRLDWLRKSAVLGLAG